MQVYALPTAKAIWDHLKRLYLQSNQSLRYAFFQTLSTCYQRDRSVQDFFAELMDIWRQCDEMTPSLCPTCSQCECAITSTRDRDFHRMYEFLMRLRPEFETVRAQLMHRVPPPPLSDTLSRDC